MDEVEAPLILRLKDAVIGGVDVVDDGHRDFADDIDVGMDCAFWEALLGLILCEG